MPNISLYKTIAGGTPNTQQLPASLKDVRNFACRRCQYKKCFASRLANRKPEPLNEASPCRDPRFFPAESVDKSTTQIPTGWDAQEYKIARENYLHNRSYGGRVNGIPAEVVFGASTGEGRLTVQEIASIEDTVMRAAALPVHEIDQIEDYVLRYAAVKEKQCQEDRVA